MLGADHDAVGLIAVDDLQGGNAVGRVGAVLEGLDGADDAGVLAQRFVAFQAFGRRFVADQDPALDPVEAAAQGRRQHPAGGVEDGEADPEGELRAAAERCDQGGGPGEDRGHQQADHRPGHAVLFAEGALRGVGAIDTEHGVDCDEQKWRDREGWEDGDSGDQGDDCKRDRGGDEVDDRRQPPTKAAAGAGEAAERGPVLDQGAATRFSSGGKGAVEGEIGRALHGGKGYLFLGRFISVFLA